MAGLLTVMMTRDPEPAVVDAAGARRAGAGSPRGERSTARVRAAPAPAPTRERTGVLPPCARAPLPRGRAAARRHWGWIAAAAVLAVAAVVAAYVWAGRGTPEAAPDEHDGLRRQTSASDDAATPVPPSRTAEETRAADGRLHHLLPRHRHHRPRAAFDQLTPEFQQASGGYEGYIGWWSKVRSAELAERRQQPVGPAPSPTPSTTVMKSGAQSTQRVRLQLQRVGDDYLIAGEG